MLILSFDAAKLVGAIALANLPATLPAGTLTGTLPNATFPATLPAVSGASLTALSAANITPGGTLPALNGAALTSLSAGNLTPGGTLPALSGAALTGLVFTQLGGVAAKAQLPATIGYLDAATFAIANGASVGGNMIISGTLTVNGGTTTVNSTTVTYTDRIVTGGMPAAPTASDPVPTAITGFSAYRGTVASVQRPHSSVVWDEAAAVWKFAFTTAAEFLDASGLQSIQALNIAATGQFNGSAAGLTAIPSAQLTGLVPIANLPIATAGSLGVVQVGSGLSVAAGVISVAAGAGGSVTGVQFGPTAGTHSGPYAGNVIVAAVDIANALTFTPANKAGDTVTGTLNLTVPTASPTSDALQVRQVGDANARFRADGTGAIFFGNGTAVTDTSIARTGAGILAMNGLFQANAFSGSGSLLTSLPSAQLTGLVPTANLPFATTGAIGAIKAGAGTSVDAAGSLSANNRTIGEALQVSGDLSLAGGAQNLDYAMVSGARTVRKIVVLVGTTAAAGQADTIVDVLMATAPGQAFVSLYTTSANRPHVVANGNVNYVVATLPDVTAIPDGAILTARIVSAPAGTKDLKVTISE